MYECVSPLPVSKNSTAFRRTGVVQKRAQNLGSVKDAKPQSLCPILRSPGETLSGVRLCKTTKQQRNYFGTYVEIALTSGQTPEPTVGRDALEKETIFLLVLLNSVTVSALLSAEVTSTVGCATRIPKFRSLKSQESKPVSFIQKIPLRIHKVD